MFKSKKKKSMAWPWRVRGLYVVLGVSLLLNVIALSSLGYLNSSKADMHLYNVAINNLCQRDYNDSVAAQTTKDDKVLLAEKICHRDAVTGVSLSNGKVVDGHYVQQ